MLLPVGCLSIKLKNMIDSVEYTVDEAYAKEREAIDPMADFRAEFYIQK